MKIREIDEDDEATRSFHGKTRTFYRSDNDAYFQIAISSTTHAHMSQTLRV
jgi:hypothetical protein